MTLVLCGLGLGPMPVSLLRTSTGWKLALVVDLWRWGKPGPDFWPAGADCLIRLCLVLTVNRRVVTNPRRSRWAGAGAFWQSSSYRTRATASLWAAMRTGANIWNRTGNGAVSGTQAGAWAGAGE